VRIGRIFLWLTIICVVLGGTLLFVKQSKSDNEREEFRVINELHDLIEQESVYDVTSDKLVEGALKGMANAINDPYSTYYTEQEAALHKQTLASERIGIGVELSQTEGKIIVIAPVKGSPADKAGIRPLDQLIQVDDTRLEGKSMGDVIKLMQGKEGEKLTLVLYRPSIDQHVKVSVKRERLKNETVHSEIIEVEGTKVGYITVTLFGEETANEWKKALDNVIAKEAEALIIDLRNNPGGYLHSVAQMLSFFEPNEKIFAHMQNHEGATEALKTKKMEQLKEYEKKLRTLPITIIQNEGSASASEVFAGALQEWKRGIIIGVTSFGKGTVQQSWQLENGGELKLSTNKWLTPSKRWIHHVGIVPDVEVVQHPLYSVETKLLKGRFVAGEFGEEVAYSQLVLKELGYGITRTDGFFDMDTGEAVSQFRKQHDLEKGRHIDELFFTELTTQLQAFKESQLNDIQLQMAISYVMHQLE
jgi:carboxyl-terminal processing protease